MPDPETIRVLRIPSLLNQLPLIDSEVERVAREMGFGDDACADVGICVTEAATNAILHAHREHPELTVEIRLEREEDALRITVRDHGTGFDPDSLADPTLPENVLKSSGRGVHLIRALMDNFEIRRLADGMQLVMVKKRRPRA
jgi:serine/threonine-protein kinase RsbW